MFSLGEKLSVEKRDRALVYTTYLTLICSGGGATILFALFLMLVSMTCFYIKEELKRNPKSL